jgi:chemotaxis protein MotB
MSSAGRGSGSHGRRPKRHEEEEHENHERWAVSYADMMTVLVGLFIVLFAISQVDQVKFEQLRRSLAVSFGNEAPSTLIGGGGALDGTQLIEIAPDLAGDTGIETEMLTNPRPADTEGTQGGNDPTVAAAQAELGRLQQIAAQIATSLREDGVEDRVRFRITERGLVIGMVADDVFFAPDTAALTPTAQRVVDAVGPVLVGLTEQVSVEGHANVLPTSRYPTNWELSSDRATQVLRRLVEADGMPPTRISAVGFGDTRPLDESGSAEALVANRRVDLVVLSPAPDEVRRLLSGLAATQQTGQE